MAESQKAQAQRADDYSWRKHLGELAPVDVKRLHALEAENNRLKRLLAEHDLGFSVLAEINANKW